MSLPDEFNGVGTRPLDLWLPVTMASALLPGAGAEWPWATADNAWLMGIARVTAGVEQLPVACDDVASRRVARTIDARHVATIEIESILPRNAESFSVEMKVASLLGGVSLLVLLIACANVMTLLLARAARQRRLAFAWPWAHRAADLLRASSPIAACSRRWAARLR